MWIWSDENPHAFYQGPLHDITVGVSCAASARQIMGSIFFNENVSSDQYVKDKLGPFFELADEQTG
jgi:hypothetical protein